MPIPKASAKTDTGSIRAGNEDCYFSDDALGLWLVADGMGGHEAGEVASAIVTQVVADEIRYGRSLSDAIQLSHKSILDAAKQGLGAHGMGSTVVAIHRTQPNHWQLGWVGDSRAYLWTQQGDNDGELQQISRDHSYVQALLESGAITEEEMENHPERNVITQCLGSVEISKVRVDIVDGDWKPKQKILLCSDGLSDELSDSRIANILNENPDGSIAVEKLIEAALQSGGRDNVTVVLISAPEVITNEKEKPTKLDALKKTDKTGKLKTGNSKIKLITGIAAAIITSVVLAWILIHFLG